MDESTEKEIKDMIEMMNKTIGETLNSDLYSSIAKAYRKQYINLENEGFSREEAMAILTSQGLGLTQK